MTDTNAVAATRSGTRAIDIVKTLAAMNDKDAAAALDEFVQSTPRAWRGHTAGAFTGFLSGYKAGTWPGDDSKAA